MSMRSLLGRVGGAITGIATGNPIGAIGSLLGMRPGGSAPPAPAGTIPAGGSGTAFSFPGFGFSHVTQGGGGGGAVAPSAQGGCPRGFHLNKHALPASKRHGAVPARTICVRNRHMNPMNGRAVSRAARRIHRGEKLLRRIFQVEGHRHGKIKPKARGRR